MRATYRVRGQYRRHTLCEHSIRNSLCFSALQATAELNSTVVRFSLKCIAQPEILCLHDASKARYRRAGAEDSTLTVTISLSCRP
jgi:hypothetical protein